MPRTLATSAARLRVAAICALWLVGAVSRSAEAQELGVFSFGEPATGAYEEPAFGQAIAEEEVYPIAAPTYVEQPVYEMVPQPAYVEYEHLPAPTYYLADRMLQSNPPPAPPSNTQSNNNSRSNNNGQGQTYGKQPEQPVVRRQFLRTQSPLLKPGDWQFDIGLAYTHFQFNFPAIDANGALVRGDLRRRTLVSPLSFRYGWSDRTQLYVNVPVGWRNTEIATSPFTTATPVDIGSNYGGVGDIQIGATHLLWKGCDGIPDCIVTLNGGLPTGEKSVLSNAFQGGLGTGFGSIGGQVMFIHSYDPVAIFWGGGYSRYFTGNIQGTSVTLGEQFVYQLGAGFAANDRVTFSGGFYGAYINPTRLNDNWVANSQQEPMKIRTAITIQRTCRIVEPFVEVGMTSTSPAARAGITWTY